MAGHTDLSFASGRMVLPRSDAGKGAGVPGWAALLERGDSVSVGETASSVAEGSVRGVHIEAASSPFADGMRHFLERKALLIALSVKDVVDVRLSRPIAVGAQLVTGHPSLTTTIDRT